MNQKKEIEDPAEKFDAIKSSIGSLGKWQILIALTIFLVKFPIAWHQLAIVFLAPPVDFQCAVPNNTEKCSSSCEEHWFNRSIFTETIITQWDLVCNRAQLANWAQTITMLGILVGSILFGYLSDKYGRKGPLAAAVVIQVISGVSCAFVPYLWLFLAFKFVSTVATAGTMVISFVLVMELIGDEWRHIIGNLYQLPFTVGYLLLALFGYLIRDWRHLQLTISLPSVLLISYYWILPESPRWLIAVGKQDSAVAVLEKAAKFNGLPVAGVAENVDRAMKAKAQSEQSQSAGNIVDLVRTPNMRLKTLVLCYCWFGTGLCFFGVAQYLGQAAGNIFVNVAISAVVQIPGTLITIYTIKAWGRKTTQIFSFALGGVSCVVIPAVPADPIWMRTTLSVIGMFALAICFGTVYIYSGELFPTVVRNVGIGLASMCARIGSMVSPFIATLVQVNEMIPPLIFGIVPIVAGVLCLLLPETLGFTLPDTISDGEEFGKKRNKIDGGKDGNVGVINMGSELEEMNELK